MAERKVLVIGSGGREHALAWALARSGSVSAVHAAPGNPGMAGLGTVFPVRADDLDGISGLVREEKHDLVVVGPEVPLALGLGDRLRAEGVAVFGPGKDGARLEASKAFAKEFMQRHRIPTAEAVTVHDLAGAERVIREWGAPLVVKASGLAAGKGVILAGTDAEARAAVHSCMQEKAFGEAGLTVVLERKLLGEEMSLFVLTDGTRIHVLPSSRDHKRAYDGDQGPNTGGMGAYSPAPDLEPALASEIENAVVARSLEGLAADGIAFRGLLYIGLMLTAEGPRVLEYNVRFGDPETQAVLPRLDWDWGEVFGEIAAGEFRTTPPEPVHAASACVVGAAADYPAKGSKGAPITGVREAERTGAIVFHAGTALDGENLVTAGGRVLNVVGRGDSLEDAVTRAYTGIEKVHFVGMRYRRDIGRSPAAQSSETN